MCKVVVFIKKPKNSQPFEFGNYIRNKCIFESMCTFFPGDFSIPVD